MKKIEVFVIILAGLLSVGMWFCVDLPTSTYTHLKNWLGQTDAQYAFNISLMYSVIGIPNLIFPLVGGILMDRVNAHFIMLFVVLVILVGQSVVTGGVLAKSIPTIVSGRFIFGCGVEVLDVSRSKILMGYFEVLVINF